MIYAQLVVNHEAQAMDRLFTYGVPEGKTVAVGQRVKVPFGQGNRRVDAFVLKVTEEAPQDLKGLKEISTIFPESYFEKEHLPLIEAVRSRYLATYLDAVKLLLPKGLLQGMTYKTSEKLYFARPGEGKYADPRYQSILQEVKAHPGEYIKADLVRMGFSQSSVNTLIKHGFLEILSENQYRVNRQSYPDYAPRVLNAAQERAVKAVTDTPGTYLLHGITGSGKTEVFLELIRRNLEAGHDSIVLVPEISLTPQMIERFKGRFGKDITIFHSRLSDGERHDEWHRVRQGRVKIAIGARSALFLPFQDLRLVIIDEEHESTYKSEMSPKYNAKEMAEFMLERKDGRLVLASATPSIESTLRAERGEITKLELPERATAGVLPEMEIVDMRAELMAGNRTIFSRPLMAAMTEALAKEEQIILFLNRRGFSTFVSCRSCGYVFKCPQCDISLTYHRDNSLMCHQCGQRKYLPKTCPSCSSKYIKQFGTGTEKVEEAIRQAFPQARVMRMDRDTTRQKDAYETMYQDFKNNRCDILIGTQMISKGLDFKDVTLVGILAADLSLNLPDYRASEKTFQLITQVAGRAGRGDKPGKVIIQSYSPEEKAIVAAKDHDYAGFYRQEVEMRRMLHNPPFSKILQIILTSLQEEVLIKNIQILDSVLRKYLIKYDKIIVLGPSPCLISKIKNQHRWQILLKGDIGEETAQAVKELVQSTLGKAQKDLKVSIDINPNSMM